MAEKDFQSVSSDFFKGDKASERLSELQKKNAEDIVRFKSAAIAEARAIKKLPKTDPQYEERLTVLREAVDAIAEMKRRYEMTKAQCNSEAQCDRKNLIELMKIQQGVQEELGAFSSLLVEKVFGIESFSETTDYDEILSVFSAISKLRSAKTPIEPKNLTTSDWMDAGHDGQWIFNDKELAQINTLYEKIQGNPKLLSTMEAILRKRQVIESDGALTRDLMQIQAENNALDKGVVVTSDETQVSKHETIREKKNGKVDVYDVFFGRDSSTLWNGSESARDIIETEIPGKDSLAKFQNAYKNVTGKEYPKNSSEANMRALVIEFQVQLASKMRDYSTLVTQLTKIKHQKADVSGTTGLTAILTGNFEKIGEEKGKELQKLVDDKRLPPKGSQDEMDLYSIAGRWGLPILAGVLTKGILVVSKDEQGVKDEEGLTDVEKKYVADKQSLSAIVHDVFMGKRFSIDFGNEHAIDGWVEDVRKVQKVFESGITTRNTSDGEELVLKIDKNSADFKNLPVAYQTLLSYVQEQSITVEEARTALVRHLIIESATCANNNDWAFRISPFFIGGGREGVTLNQKSAQNGVLLAQEGALTKTRDFAEIGATFERKLREKTATTEASSEFIWTIPESVQMVKIPDNVRVNPVEINGKKSIQYISSSPMNIQRVVTRNTTTGVTSRMYQLIPGEQAPQVSTTAPALTKKADALTHFESQERDLKLIEKLRLTISYLPGSNKTKQLAANFSELYGKLDTRNPADLVQLKAAVKKLFLASEDKPVEMRKFVNALQAADAPTSDKLITMIRYGLMTDITQAKMLMGQKVNKDAPRDFKNGKSAISGLGFKDALAVHGNLSVADFKEVLPTKQIHQVGPVLPNTVAMVAGWKMKPAGMTYAKPGDVDIAQMGGKELRKDISDVSKKTAMLNELMASDKFKKYELVTIQKTIESALKDTGKTLSAEEIKNLIITGEHKFSDGTKMGMDNKFFLFAYGACGNPSVGLTLGAVAYYEKGPQAIAFLPKFEEVGGDFGHTQEVKINAESLGINLIAAAAATGAFDGSGGNGGTGGRTRPQVDPRTPGTPPVTTPVTTPGAF